MMCYSPSEGNQHADASVENVITDLPAPQVQELSDNKSESIATRVFGRKDNIAGYYDSCLVNSRKDTVTDPVAAVGGPSVQSGQTSSTEKTSQEIFGDVARQTNAPSQQPNYRETPQQREERHRRRREEAVQMANEMSQPKGIVTSSQPKKEERINIGSPSSTGTRRSGVISSLGESSGEISSLQNEQEIYSSDSEHPFRCLFLKNEKVKSGQKVTIRLLEDMIVGAYVIPKNTHLQAYATIDSRLDLEISSIEFCGHILPLGYVAYDTDGLKGIYCPDAGDASRTVKTSGLSTIGSVIGGRVGRVAGEVVNTGVSIAQSAAGERTVNVPAGYNFFIVKKKQN